jgi:hypothetical protein
VSDGQGNGSYGRSAAVRRAGLPLTSRDSALAEQPIPTFAERFFGAIHPGSVRRVEGLSERDAEGSGSHVFILRQLRRLLVGDSNLIAVECVGAFEELAGFLFDDHGEFGLRRGAGCHRIIAADASFAIGGLIAMAAGVPGEDANGIELVAFGAFLDGCPKPIVFDQIALAVADFAQREIRANAMSFGVLRHFIGNGHDEVALQGPADAAIVGADEAPIFQGIGFFGFGFFRERAHGVETH